jgi:DNA polymerase-3 subunit gamma/tau
MSYLVLSRKYRPQTFDQVVGQTHVTSTLSNAVVSNRMHHAILFAGPRGTGKTTVARILAKVMNCKEGPAPVPCDICRSCREITAGNSVDVFEIDGASNNSVDQIRELRQNIKYMPAHSLYKIYIIDEVHMLSIAAFNALLKTLEEPPEHVMFIFATTELHKIPATIISRCQRYDFRRIHIQSIADQMNHICMKENIDIPSQGLDLIAHEAGGSMRDALSLLDQIMASADGIVTFDHVMSILGVMDRKVMFDMSAGILKGDITAVIDIIDDLFYSGHDLIKCYSDLIEHFRNLFVVKMGQRIDKLVDLPDHEIDLIRDQIKDIPMIYLNQILHVLLKEGENMRYAGRPKLAFEMVLIKVLHIKPALLIDDFIEKLDRLKTDVFPFVEHESKVPSEVCTDKKQEKEKGFAAKENLGGTWGKICEIISQQHPSLAANLANSSIVSLTENQLEIEVNGSQYNIDMVKRDANVSLLKNVCNVFFKKNMDLVIKEKKNTEDKKQEKNRTAALQKKALDDPMIAEAVEIFKGKIVEVKVK